MVDETIDAVPMPIKNQKNKVVIVGAGRYSLALAAAVAIAGSSPVVHIGMDTQEGFPYPDNQRNQYRRSEKDSAAIAKAELKRQRKAKKRLKGSR